MQWTASGVIRFAWSLGQNLAHGSISNSGLVCRACDDVNHSFLTPSNEISHLSNQGPAWKLWIIPFYVELPRFSKNSDLHLHVRIGVLYLESMTSRKNGCVLVEPPWVTSARFDTDLSRKASRQTSLTDADETCMCAFGLSDTKSRRICLFRGLDAHQVSNADYF